ncbi:MAG: hypothetical protein AB2745_08615 [Candidatus Thiodiazotropha endolucinida]
MTTQNSTPETDSLKILRQENHRLKLELERSERMCDLAIHCELHMQINKEEGIAYMPLDEWLDWRNCRYVQIKEIDRIIDLVEDERIKEIDLFIERFFG